MQKPGNVTITWKDHCLMALRRLRCVSKTNVGLITNQLQVINYQTTIRTQSHPLLLCITFMQPYSNLQSNFLL